MSGQQPKRVGKPNYGDKASPIYRQWLGRRDAISVKIKQELASIAVRQWDKRLSSDKIKCMVNRYKRPEKLRQN